MRYFCLSVDMLLRITLFVSLLGGLTFGYNADIVSGAILFIRGQYHLGVGGTETFLTEALLGGLIAIVATGFLTDIIGRRVTLIVASAAVAAGPVVSVVFSQGFDVDLGRAILGWGLGSMSVATPLYLFDVVPVSHRGRILAVFPCALTAGGLISHVVQLVLSEGGYWQSMLLLGSIPALVQFIGLCLFAPKATTLQKIPRTTWKDIFSQKVRFSMMVGVILAGLEQATGINALDIYAPILLEQAGFNTPSSALAMTLVLTLTGLMMTLAAVLLVDRVGRKPLLTRGLQLMALALFAVSLGFRLQAGLAQQIIVGVSLFIYAAAFNLSLGTLIWVLIPENFSSKYRAKGVSLALLVNWLCNVAVSRTLLSVAQGVGDSALFLIFGMLTLLAMVFVKKYVHEAVLIV